MRKLVTHGLFSLVICFFAFSCKEEVSPTPYTYSSLLSGKTSKTWKAVGLIALREDGNEYNYGLDQCERDDRYIFYAGIERRFEFLNGNVSCSEDEPINTVLIDDTWAVVNASATLLTFFPPLAGDFKLPFIIQKLDKDKMILDIFADQENTIRYRVSFEVASEE